MDSSFVVPKSEYNGKKGNAPNEASSSGSSEHFEYIEELGYKEQYNLAHSLLPMVFVDYQPLLVIAKYYDKMGQKRKINKGGYRLVDEPSGEVASSGGKNLEIHGICLSRLVQDVECNECWRAYSTYLVI